MRVIRKLVGAIEGVVRRKGMLREYWYPRCDTMMTPRQQVFLAKCLDEAEDIDGAIVEIGCAYGVTTAFLHGYAAGFARPKTYTCVDTFSGFTADDMAVEVAQRAKKKEDYIHPFTDNKVEWFRDALKWRNITDVEIIQGDIVQLSADRLPPQIAFCLIDVDLYRPVKVALEKVWNRMATGGIIVVDDCWFRPTYEHVTSDVATIYDGAMQAYREFCEKHRLEPSLHEDKLGVLRKP